MVQKMHQLKRHKDIVYHESIKGKGTLIFCDDLGKEQFKVIGKSLRYNLVNHVTKTYGSEFSHPLRITCFWDKGYVSFIELGYRHTTIKDI